MINFTDVLKRIREILTFTLKKDKVLDKDIALSLGLDPQYYAVIKRRKKIPYEKLAYFCKKHKISMNYILLNQEPKYLT